MSDSVRVLLVDDHPLVRAGIRRVLETRPGLTVVGEASDGAEALRPHRDACIRRSWCSIWRCRTWTAWKCSIGSGAAPRRCESWC